MALRIPEWCRNVLFHALVLSHFENCNLLLTDISSALWLSLGKQLNWAFKTVVYRSRNKCSTSLRIFEEIRGMKQRLDSESFDLLFSILRRNKRTVFQNHPKLVNWASEWIIETKTSIIYNKVQVSFLMDPSLYLCEKLEFFPHWL